MYYVCVYTMFQIDPNGSNAPMSLCENKGYEWQKNETFMEKIYSTLLMNRNSIKKEFLKFHNGLLRVDHTCTKKHGLIGRPAGAS